MKTKIAMLALLAASLPAFASARGIMWPPGPTLWDSLMRFFGG
jgi:hypothetical protein